MAGKTVRVQAYIVHRLKWPWTRAYADYEVLKNGKDKPVCHFISCVERYPLGKELPRYQVPMVVEHD